MIKKTERNLKTFAAVLPGFFQAFRILGNLFNLPQLYKAGVLFSQVHLGIVT